MNPMIKKLHSIGTTILLLAVALLLWSIWVGFIHTNQFSMGEQVAAHITIMLAGGLLKIGYVIRLASEHEANLIQSI